MKTNFESFDDIVFENRNKDYGAYELRKKYSKRGVISLAISIFLFFSAVGGPLIENMLNPVVINGYVPVDYRHVMTAPDIDKPVVPPPPPPPPADIRNIKFTAPTIVDTLSKDEVDLATNDDLLKNANVGTVDTATHMQVITIQPKEDFDNDTLEIINITEKPRFPDGDAGLLKYVAEHTKYPEQAINNNIEGTVYIRFVVTKTGEVGDAKVMRAVDPLLESEALRVIKSQPRWTPGKNNGRPVNVWFIIPVKFKLQER